MVSAGRIGLALLAAAATCAVARPQRGSQSVQDAARSAVGESSAPGTRPITGHIIIQSAEPVSTAGPDETSEDTAQTADSHSSEPTAAADAEHGKTTRAECMATGAEDWDSRLQVGGVFIIMATGFAGAMLPIASRHIEWLSGGTRVFTVGKFFGAGVVLATAFVHMFGAAIETLGDQCLEGRMGDYDNWPALLAMMAILAMHLMEHVLTRRISHAHSSTEPAEETSSQPGSVEKEHGHATVLISDEKRKRLSTYLLELGIALHSVIIGMTLAITGGSEYKTLLAAISVHQFFEGMAVGARVSTLNFRNHPFALRVLNAAIFALTTPLGQAIGIGIRQSFAPRSPSSLIIMGILESLSAGILMYSAIVNLLVEEFASTEFSAFGRVLRTVCFVSTYLGCAAMSIIGKWA